MNIELRKLELMNFKGIKNLTIDFSKETNIYGRNATGKTTIFDSFTWLLFGKDSANRADFNIKTLNKNGETIHGLEHQVTGTLFIGDKKVTLRRVLKENWVKKRGSADAVLSGNITDYFVNEVPKKEKEYKEYINSLIDENVFKLLTNPLYFNINTSWQDRRKILLEVVGDISDEDVINSKNSLNKLSNFLDGNSIEDFKAMVGSKKKKLNEQLKAIPIRIDEINRGLPALASDVDYEAFENERVKIKGNLEVINNQLTNQKKVAEDFIRRQQDLSLKKSKLQSMELQIEKDSMKDLNKKKFDLMQLSFDKEKLQKSIENTKKDIVSTNTDMQAKEKEAEGLRIQYREQFATEFMEPDRDNFICPTCKQKLPVDDIENKIIEMHQSFEDHKHYELESIKQMGIQKKNIIDKHKDFILELNEKIKSCEYDLAQLNGKIAILTPQIETEEKQEHVVDYNTNAEYKALNEEIRNIEKNLLPVDGNNRVKEQYDELQDRMQEINTILSSKKAIEDAQARILELEKEEKKFSQQIADLEGQEFLCEEFTKAKVNLLEQKINSTFKYVTFKMFDIQMNGGLSDTCQALIDGIPFVDANNAAKYNAGIDIINALGEFYKTTCPIFIDNREGIDELIETESQIINLFVSKQDKVLRVEAAPVEFLKIV